MSLDDGSTLLSLAHTISILTSQVHAYLKETAQPEPSFSPSSVEIDTNSTFEELRSSLTDATNDLLQLVNGPKRTLRTLYGTHYDLAANQVALEFDFFALIPVNGTSTVKQLAEATKLNPDIVARVLRILTTQHIFLEVEDGVFMHTAASATIARDEDLKASFAMQMDEVFQAASVTATSLKTNSGKLEAGTCPFSERFGVPIFGYYKEKPEKGERFGKAMAGAQKLDRNLNALVDQYDWQSLPEGPVVDVGGAEGSTSLVLAKRFPNLNFIVQDQSPALLSLGSSKLPQPYLSRFTFQQHDFFIPQPVTNASAFFIRQCLHNWPDSEAVKILRAFVPALKQCRGDTHLIINESILPGLGQMKRGEERLIRQVDMSMMINVGARQRTEGDFRRLLNEADKSFEVVKVHNTGSMGLLVIRLQK